MRIDSFDIYRGYLLRVWTQINCSRFLFGNNWKLAKQKNYAHIVHRIIIQLGEIRVCVRAKNTLSTNSLTHFTITLAQQQQQQQQPPPLLLLLLLKSKQTEAKTTRYIHSHGSRIRVMTNK